MRFAILFAIVLLLAVSVSAQAGQAGALDTLIGAIAGAEGHAVFQYSFTESNTALGLIGTFPFYRLGTIDNKPINLTANILGTSDDNGVHLGAGVGITIPKAVAGLTLGIDYATTRGWCLDVGIFKF